MCPSTDDAAPFDHGADDPDPDDVAAEAIEDELIESGLAASTPDARHALVEIPFATLTVVSDGTAITGIYFDPHTHRPDPSTFGPQVDAETDAVLGLAARQLAEYFAGSRTEFELPLSTDGNEFQERVWDRLRHIPHGDTITYGEIAAELGDVGMAQAVGGAVGRNPISIVVPCHRVVGSTGKLTGYAGGVERKAALLELEEPESTREQRLF